jgi:hypothetical protein
MLRKIPGTARQVVICGSLLLSAGCHKKVVLVQPPFIRPTLAPAPVATIPEPEPVPDTTPPPIEPPAVAINPDALPAPLPAPSKPSPPARARTVPVTPEPVAPVTPIPAPSLGVILSADERKKLEVEYQADLRQASEVLNSIRGRALTPSQNDTVDRARAFISQAAQYHDRDLATAAEQARRARVLTQDLAGAH